MTCDFCRRIAEISVLPKDELARKLQDISRGLPDEAANIVRVCALLLHAKDELLAEKTARCIAKEAAFKAAIADRDATIKALEDANRLWAETYPEAAE